MKNFIEELYFGNIDPQARFFEADSRYGKALSVINENEELLSKRLKDEELRSFLDLMEAWSELTGITSLETFTDGFRLGAAFALDVSNFV